MSEAKIKIKIGSISFSGEGESDWLGHQLDKVLAAVPELLKAHSNEILEVPSIEIESSLDQPETSGEEFTEVLVNHIRAKGGESNQVQRFLATADWLRRRGETKLTTGKVTKALRENHQKRLSNASDSLNQNVRKGYCEKDGDGFFITPDGLKALGYR